MAYNRKLTIVLCVLYQAYPNARVLLQQRAVQGQQSLPPTHTLTKGVKVSGNNASPPLHLLYLPAPEPHTSTLTQACRPSCACTARNPKLMSSKTCNLIMYRTPLPALHQRWLHKAQPLCLALLLICAVPVPLPPDPCFGILKYLLHAMPLSYAEAAQWTVRCMSAAS